jgi:glycosyltransferase involved in cell wall biosynthesis
MRRADVIVRPSFTEGMPLSLLEAMASGACLVVSDIAGNRDLIRHNYNGLLVAAARPDLLADELERVLLSPGLRERLSTAAFSESQRYSWDKCAAETLAVLEQTAFQSNAVA